VDRAIQFGKVCALVALTLLLASLLMLVLELRASEMRLAAKADAVLDQASIAAGTATRYSVTQERALRGNEAQLSKLLVATNNSLNGCPKCLPLILHADDLVDSVALKSSLSHIDSTTAHLDKSMEHIEFKVNQFVHPSKKQKAWDRFKDGLGVGLTVLRHIVF
jgi:hypothetical protein